MAGVLARTGADTSLYPVAAQFPLGRPFGLLPASEDAGDGGELPFGLRRAVVNATVPMGDLTRYRYDHDRQIGVVREGDQTVPLFRHTTGQTRTTTTPDGYQGPDSDTDHRED